ncbi:diguanylate cyclase [Porphyrobacter algicida]|uniref:diguanylate cyclase n=1 Tax=Qipengyuania algicida TaxID=1836209 RepID=A0A845AHB6_9SPHN|nr:diguanylate cyclase [Qipengyuania algicida]MXP28829.1 diguanylate cyclase [Qipengyuania algicida]
MRRVHATFLAIIVALLALVYAPTSAKADSLFRNSCLLSTDLPLTFSQAFSSKQWNCRPQYHQAITGHSWQKLDIDGAPDGNFVIETVSGPLERVRVVGRDHHGILHQQVFAGAALSRLWMPGNGLAVPVAVRGDKLSALYLAFDGTPSSPPATELAFKTADQAHQEKVSHSVLYALAMAVLGTIAIFSAFMGIASDNRTVALHGAFSALVAVYTASSSSLVFLAFPSLTLWDRAALSYASLSLAVAMLGPIMSSFFERRIFCRIEKRAMLATAALAALGSICLPLSLLVDFNARVTYHLLFLPGIFVLIYGIAVATMRRSRNVGGFILAWAAPLTLGIERVLRGAGLYYLPSWIDSLFFIALAAQALIMAGAIALQAEAVRRERDLAHDRAREMEDEALTDALTGLYNRRDFDARKWRRSDILAIVDLDRFKPINDGWGHDTGDEVLRAVGRVLGECVADNQALRAWRLGGEEFAVALTGPSIDSAAIILNTVRQKITAAARSAVPQVDRRITASAGLAMVGQQGMRQAFRAADAALYRAKAAGRDRLCYESGDMSFATIFPKKRRAA